MTQHRFIAMATGPSRTIFPLPVEVRGEAVGGIGVHPLDDVRRQIPRRSGMASESCRGRGIVTDAVRALVPVAFEQIDIVRIQAGIFSNNRGIDAGAWKNAGLSGRRCHRNAITKNGVMMDEMCMSVPR